MSFPAKNGGSWASFFLAIWQNTYRPPPAPKFHKKFAPWKVTFPKRKGKDRFTTIIFQGRTCHVNFPGWKGAPQDVEVHIVVLKLNMAPKQKSMWLVSIQSRLNINWVLIGQRVATKFTIISTMKAKLVETWVQDFEGDDNYIDSNCSFKSVYIKGRNCQGKMLLLHFCRKANKTFLECFVKKLVLFFSLQ